jgi:hypothetical protein
MPAYLSGFCRRLGKNKRIQRWLDRLRRAPAHVELTVPLMTTWRYLTGRPPKSLSCVQAVTKCPILSSVCSTEKPGHVIRSGAGSKGRTRECNDGCTGLSRAPAHVELAVPLVDDWSTSGGPSSHSAFWPQDVISSQTKYRPIWSSRYFWGISYVPCGDTSKLDLHCHRHLQASAFLDR